jgi:hypothetical protein
MLPCGDAKVRSGHPLEYLLEDRPQIPINNSFFTAINEASSAAPAMLSAVRRVCASAPCAGIGIRFSPLRSETVSIEG